MENSCNTSKKHYMRIGLRFAFLISSLHIIWAILVAFGYAKFVLDTFYQWHFIDFQFNILPFSFMGAIKLFVVTFIIGYIIGWLLAMMLLCVKE